MTIPRRRGVSAKTRLTVMLLLTVTIITLVISLLVWQTSRTALEDAIEARISTINTIKARQVQDLIADVREQIAALSENEMFINAMVNFNRSYEDLESQQIPSEWEAAVEDYYVSRFFPQLAGRVVGELEFEGYRPGGQGAFYIQYHYIAAQADAENRVNINTADDGSTWSTTHLRYHARFRRLIESFGYEDMYLVDFETGNVVYSVQKEVDLGTSVLTGPYRRSGLGAVVREIQRNPARRSVQLVDYQRYQPVLTAPAAFVGAPIYNGPHVVGILVLRLPTSEINRIVTCNQQWQASGLGASGQSFLISDDLLMRSNARAFIEQRAAYLDDLLAIGVNQIGRAHV